MHGRSTAARMFPRRQPRARATTTRRSTRIGLERCEPRTPLAVSGSLVDGVLSIQSSAAKDLISLIASQTTYTVAGTGMQPTAFPRASVTAIKIGDAGSVNLAGQTVLLGSSNAGSIVDPITVTGIEVTALNCAVSVSEGSGDIVFGGPVLLPENKISLVTNRQGNVRFQSTINGSGYLRLAAEGAVELVGRVGNVSPLRGLKFDWADVVVGRSSIVIDGRWGSVENDGLRVGRHVGGLLLDGVGSSVTRSTSGIRIDPNDADDPVGFFSGRTIRNFKLSQNTAGVRFDVPSPQDPLAADEPVFRNWTLTDNKITGNSLDGIHFEADDQGRSTTANITISGNTITLNKKDGIRVNGTPEGLLIQKNTLTGNGTLSGDAAIRFTDGLGQPRLNVKVDGNSIGFFNPLAPKVAIGTGIAATNLPGLRITGNTLTNLAQGVSLAGDFTRADASPVLAANTFTRNSTGIRLESATNVTIDATNAVNTSRSTGLWASGNSTGSIVTGVTFQNAKAASSAASVTGITLSTASGITISGVSVSNGSYGLWLDAVAGVSITSASVTGAGRVGIRAAGNCQGSTITTPTLTDNADAVSLAAASGLMIQGGTITGVANATGVELSGDCAGTTVSGVEMTTIGLGVSLKGAKGATISGIEISLGGAGLTATGACTGTTVTGLAMAGGTNYGAVISAQGLTLKDSSFRNNTSGGLWAYGNCTGTVVTATAFDDNQVPTVEDGVSSGIKLGGGGEAGAVGLTITNCTASGNESAGLLVRGDSTGSTISGCTFDNNGTDGVNLYDAKGLTLAAGNSATGNTQWGLWAGGACTATKVTGASFSGNASGIQLLSATGIALGDLTVNGNDGFGLFVNGPATGVTLSGSTFSGNTTGIMLAHAQGLAIQAGNTIQGNDIGLSAFGTCTGTNVVGTTIKNNTGRGVFLTGATNLKINGLNKIQGNGDGVYVTGTCTGTLVNGNLIGGNTNAGLWLQDATAFQAKNNTITNNQSVGLRATGNATGTVVTGNTITANKTNIVVTATGGTFQKV